MRSSALLKIMIILLVLINWEKKKQNFSLIVSDYRKAKFCVLAWILSNVYLAHVFVSIWILLWEEVLETHFKVLITLLRIL